MYSVILCYLFGHLGAAPTVFNEKLRYNGPTIYTYIVDGDYVHHQNSPQTDFNPILNDVTVDGDFKLDVKNSSE